MSSAGSWGLAREILGRRIVEGPPDGLDSGMAEPVFTEQVLAGAPLVEWPAERSIGGVRRVDAWSALRSRITAG
jgi:hypothetical protein